METTNKYVWVGMARMEMASNLKSSGRIFQAHYIAASHLISGSSQGVDIPLLYLVYVNQSISNKDEE